MNKMSIMDLLPKVLSTGLCICLAIMVWTPALALVETDNASLSASISNEIAHADTLALTLANSITISLGESISIKQLEQSMFWARQNLKAARAGYRSNAEFRFYLPAYDEGYKLIEQVEGTPIAKKSKSLQVRGVMDLIQPLPWLPLGGGDLTFRSEAFQLNSWDPSYSGDVTELKSNQFFSSLSLIFNKPLLTINNLSLGLRRAELAYERQVRVYKRSELDLIYQVKNSFYQLYSRSEQKTIAIDKVSRQEDIFGTTQNKYAAGLIAEVDAMQAKVQLIQARNEFKQAESALIEQESSFKQLIGLPLDKAIRIVVDLSPARVTVSPEQALELAMQNRSEITEQQIDIKEQEISVEQIDARTAIKGNLRGYYRLSGYSDSDLRWGTDTADLFDSSWEVLKQTPNRGVTFELEVPIWDWGRNKAETEAAIANLRKEELRLENLFVSIEREVRDVVRRLDETWDRLAMLEESNRVSQKSFDINLQRFANGDITSTELDRSSAQLNEAKYSYLAAYMEYKMTLADLERKTLYNFETGQSLIEYVDPALSGLDLQ
jgi:outer membrane protein